MSLVQGSRVAGVAALAVLTVVLVVLAMTRSMATGSVDSQPFASVDESEPTAVVTVVGDDHVLDEGSWFYRTVPAEAGGPVERGVVLGGVDATAAGSEDALRQVAPGDVVLLAVGSVDLERGSRPPEIVSDIRTLVRGIREIDAVPVVALLPPTDSRGFLTKLTNNRLRTYAERRNVGVLDVFSPVAAVGGGWNQRFSDDGDLANPAGSARQAQAATSRLDWLVAARLQAG